MAIIYAIDTKTNITYPGKKEFEKFNLSIDSIKSLSIKNLNNIVPEITKQEKEDWYYIIAGGDYEACLILLSDIWTKENFPVSGDIVVAIPNRDILMITGSNNPSGLKIIKQNVRERFNEGSYPITTKLFKFNGTTFEVFE